MPFQLSAGINVSEIDLTTVVPAVATTEGAIAGVFRWGPVNERILVDSETKLAKLFGAPTNFNAETFFVCADFLSYGNKLYVTRVASNTASNAGAANTQVLTRDAAEAITSTNFIARYPGALGNNLTISICPNEIAYRADLGDVTMNLGENTADVANAESVSAGDIVRIGSINTGYQNLTVASVSNNTITFTGTLRLSANTDLTGERYWGHFRSVERAPQANTIHVAVVDRTGAISGSAGTVLEVYESVSVNPSAKTEDGSNNFYREVINSRSAWVYATGNNATATGNVVYTPLAGGSDGADESTISLADLAKGYDLYASAEDIDISLILQGKAVHGLDGSGLANYIIDNICETRKDCIAFISPPKTSVVNNPNGERNSILNFIESLSRSSYAVLDSGYKYRYDKYNDVYRWVPLNGDIAGLVVRTDDVRDPWYSPAGYNRGILKNVVKLAYNPGKADRDILYPAGCNPVITENGSGTLLLGDKTLLGRPSAFDRINVRRLFIVLEKAIARAAKSTLFEFNDEFTRAQFRNLIEPYLRDVKGRRGIYDFRVVCDESNNTPEVIDRNEFIGDIYIKPARSISFIQLNFVAVRTGVEFDEIVGRFG